MLHVGLRNFFLVFCLTFILTKAHTEQSIQPTFVTEEISFNNGKIKLSATLFIPSAGIIFPAIVITHGSGRDSKSHPGFIAFATELVKENFVVLIFDKRGVGASTGVYIETPDMSVPAGDLICAVEYLQTRKEVNRNKIGVYGHSQGGWVAPLAAAIYKNISFVVAACGGGISVREQVLYSYRSDLRKSGIAESKIDSAIDFGRELFLYLGTGIGYTTVNSVYETSKKQKWFSFYRKMGFADQLPPPSVLKSPGFNFFKATLYDPQAALRSLDIPTLVLLGEKDEFVPSGMVRKSWEEAYLNSGNSNKLTVVVLEEEDHYDFERVKEGVRYKPSFLNILTKWLKEKI